MSMESKSDGISNLFLSVIQDKKIQADLNDRIKTVMPKYLNADRMLRIALTELRTLEINLRQARKKGDNTPIDQNTFLGAIIQCAQLGLEPGDLLGRCYLIPFKNKKTNKKECKIIIGYKGYIDLVGRNDKIILNPPQIVYPTDFFEFERGTNEYLRHKYELTDKRGKEQGLIGAYAKIIYPNTNIVYFHVLTKDDIEKARESSVYSSSPSSPWTTDYGSMAKKTVIRNLCKYLSLSSEVQQAITLDERGDIGKQQFNFNLNNEDITHIEPEEPKKIIAQTDQLREDWENAAKDK